MKKWKIEKTKPTFIISTFKTDIIKVDLVFSISNFFIAKTFLANNWRSFSSSYWVLLAKKARCKLDTFVMLFWVLVNLLPKFVLAKLSSGYCAYAVLF